MFRVTDSGVGRGPVLTPSPASWIRTLIMSTGWMTAVAVMPARPPLTNGKIARTNGLCRKSLPAIPPLEFPATLLLSVVGASASVSLVALEAASLFRLAALTSFEGVDEDEDAIVLMLIQCF